MARRYYGRSYRRAPRRRVYFRRYGRRFRRYATSYGIVTSPVYWGGVAVGALTDIDNRIPTHVKLAVATMPIGGRGALNDIKKLAQGMVFGDVMSDLAGGSLQILNTSGRQLLGKTF